MATGTMAPPTLTSEQETAILNYIKQQRRSRELKHELKVLLLGIGGCGKQSIVLRLTTNEYWERPYDPTGPDSPTGRQVIKIQQNPFILEYDVCDHHKAEPESSRPFLEFYLKSYDIVFLVYDVGDRWSLEGLKTIRERYLSTTNATPLTGEAKVSGVAGIFEDKPIWVLASKNDRPAETWKVSTEEGEEFAKSIGATFKSVSALTGDGLKEDFVIEMVNHLFLERAEKAEQFAKAEEERKRKERAEAASKKKWGRWPFGEKLRRMVYARREAKKSAAINTI